MGDTQYRGLAPYYSSLFPVGKPLADFLSPSTDTHGGNPWLDVGCGTGALVHWLLDRGVNAFGVDPDPDFIDEAKRRSESRSHRFEVGGMEDFGPFEEQCFAVIVCLGNVLSHANDLSEIDRFISKASQHLHAEGDFFVQIVNYDRVLDRGDFDFPIIERKTSSGETLRFHRTYVWEGERLLFFTRLEVGGKNLENESYLLPVRSNDLEEIVRRYFSDATRWGDFSKQPWHPGSPATVIQAKK